ncbi:MAG TPA: hypothetical protein VFV82_12645 [Candidatus Binatia bacterium]|nr:hypothetical protein [Candidatus Binatia bacterium]
MLVLFAAPLNGAENSPEVQLAAAFELPKVPGLPSLTGPSADWRQFDSFFTFVIKRFGEDVPGNLKDSLGDAFLDSRYELTSAIAPGRGGNPVPELFVNGWRRLSPIMNQALPTLPQQTASLYSSFIGAADKLALTGGAGLNLTPDALRGMARLLAPSSAADPWPLVRMSMGVCAICSDSVHRSRSGRAGSIKDFSPAEARTHRR